MKAKIVGIEDASYVKKDTGELVQMLNVYLNSPSKSEKIIGEVAKKETLTASRNPDEIALILSKDVKQLIGKQCFISKGVSSFGGKSYEYIEEFEIL